MHPEQIILEPLVTEKAVGGKAFSRYVFKVHLWATKLDISRAVEKLFKVKVRSVNTCKVKPKTKRTGMFEGRTQNWKKAYIALSAGQKIEELEA